VDTQVLKVPKVALRDLKVIKAQQAHKVEPVELVLQDPEVLVVLEDTQDHKVVKVVVVLLEEQDF
jgi:hypothetical protein|tara:strand:+ start:175 stop:369 length:195 start_codon:yes stop_codon:yes gene_type:complete